MRNRRRAERIGDVDQRDLACLAIVNGDAYLDEAVCLQRDIDLAHHRGCQAVMSDDDDGVQRMRAGA